MSFLQLTYNMTIIFQMKIIKTETKDGLILNGLLFEPAEKTCKIIINIHGMSGDPYSSSFYPAMISLYPANKIAFLSTENRGTHSVTQFNTTEGTTQNIGNIYELFDDCLYDIQGWVNKALELGYTEIWLQGHSLGTSKVIYFMDKTPSKNVHGIILLSPWGMMEFDKEEQLPHARLLLEAEELIAKSKENQILSESLFGDDALMSAKTYISFFGNKSKTGIFDYSSPNSPWEAMNMISVPVIAFTGDKDDGIVPDLDPYEAMKILESQLINCPTKKTIVFDGADHDFSGFGDRIAREVISFSS